MTKRDPFQDGRALFERLTSTYAAAERAPELDHLTLAAYAEGRLDADAAVAVEQALSSDPQAMETVIALRQSLAPEIPSRNFLARAQALVGASTAAILPFRPQPTIRPIQSAMAWSAVAASLVLVSLLGFDLGVHAERTLSTTSQDAPFDLIDQSGMLGDSVG